MIVILGAVGTTDMTAFSAMPHAQGIFQGTVVRNGATMNHLKWDPEHYGGNVSMCTLHVTVG
eukprot:m.1653609 g.1653609  ORF g.1653609 m.1653609 type:complete len:62 (+) comp98384_c0_seq1:175-360(+)